MVDVRSPVFKLTFLSLVTAATLFPPFNWGQEWLTTEAERRLIMRHPWMYERLPIKTYAFLFGNSKKAFLVNWGWDSYKQESIPIFRALERRLNTTELLLEYVLALVVAVFASQISTWISVRRKRGAA